MVLVASRVRRRIAVMVWLVSVLCGVLVTAGSSVAVAAEVSAAATAATPQISIAPAAEACPSPAAIEQLQEKKTAVDKKINDSKAKASAVQKAAAATAAEHDKLLKQSEQIQKDAKTLDGKISALNETISAHNQEQIDRTSVAAVNAYNAEAEGLNQQVTGLKQQADALKKRVADTVSKAEAFEAKFATQSKSFATLGQQIAKMQSEVQGLTASITAAKLDVGECALNAAFHGDVPNVPPARASKLGNAKKNLPPGTTMPKNNSPKFDGVPIQAARVPKNHPARESFDAARDASPERTLGDAELQGEPRPKATDIDPSTGRPFGTTEAGSVPVAADHIIPIAGIMELDGYFDLTETNQWYVLNARINLQWLSVSTNSAKQDRSAIKLLGKFKDEWIAEQLVREKAARAALEELIASLLSSQ